MACHGVSESRACSQLSQFLWPFVTYNGNTNKKWIVQLQTLDGGSVAVLTGLYLFTGGQGWGRGHSTSSQESEERPGGMDGPTFNQRLVIKSKTIGINGSV